MSIVGAITPLVKAAQLRHKARWALNAFTYTVAGAAASAIIGLALWALGGWFPAAVQREAGIPLAIAAGCLVVARELDVVRLPLLQPRRATPGAWARNLEGPIVPALWGFDLGLFFTTFFTFSGAWLLVLLALGAATPLFAVAIMVAYWSGRALSVWLAPLLLPDATATPQLLVGFTRQYRQFRLIHVVSVGFMTAVLVGMILSATPLG